MVDALKVMTEAILQYYTPGVLISLQYDVDLSMDSILEISFHKELQSLLSKDVNQKFVTMNKVEEMSKPTQKIDLDAMGGGNLSSMIQRKNQTKANRFDDIIERLERKYTTLHTSNPVQITYDYDDSSSDSENEALTPSNADLLNPEVNAGQPIQKKKKVKAKKVEVPDYYDLDDDFIDDSENAENIETMVKMKVLKTKQSGFFVSSGDLEVLEDDPNLYESSESDSSNDDSDNDSTSSLVENDSNPSKPRHRHHASNKPSWTPNEDVLAALEVFKQNILALNLKPLAKSSAIPLVINKCLFELHQTVKLKYNHHPVVPSSTSNESSNIATPSVSVVAEDVNVSLLNKTSGYLEAISDVLGGNVPIGKIRRLINQLEMKHESDKKLHLIKTLIHNIKALIPNRIGPAPPVSLMTGPSTATAGNAEEDGHDMDIDAKSAIQYKYRCRWDMKLRASFVQLDELVSEYVKLENVYRLSLTVVDMRYLPDEEVSMSRLCLQCSG